MPSESKAQSRRGLWTDWKN